jgi:hypothetical protein
MGDERAHAEFGRQGQDALVVGTPRVPGIGPTVYRAQDVEGFRLDPPSPTARASSSA